MEKYILFNVLRKETEGNKLLKTKCCHTQALRVFLALKNS